MYSRLRQTLVAFQARELSWDCLIQEAEKQGVASLLHKHICSLDFTIPDNARRLLQSLYLRNRRSNTIRNKAVTEILNSCHFEKIDVLIVKGIALCNFAYSEIGLRPMRDIDLLVKKVDIVKAENILFDLGYLPEEKHDIPDDYYHLVPMGKTIDGLPVSIELHHNLLPFHPQYPLWPLEKSYNTALELEINGARARTLCLEDTLWYVYLHGFQAPLTYEPFRFMHVADIVSLVEKFLDVMNWQVVQKEVPILLNVISRFHYLTPWQNKVVAQLKLDIRKQPDGTGLPYRGWPKHKLAKVKKKELFQLTKDTLWPSQWWMQIYYGHLRGTDYLKARFIDHPRMLWRWAKAYLYLYVRNSKESRSNVN
jgi:hypothetical protein